jgi:2-C-methyl-D-erythritol 4-phosphate cytidylyltransferase
VVVPGSPENFKITTKDDLALAEAVLKARKSQPAGPALGFGEEAKW